MYYVKFDWSIGSYEVENVKSLQTDGRWLIYYKERSHGTIIFSSCELIIKHFQLNNNIIFTP